MNGKLRELLHQLIKAAFAFDQTDSNKVMANTIIGAALDAGLTIAELQAAIKWHKT